MIVYELDHPTLRLGVVRAEGVRFARSPAALLDEVHEAEQRVRDDAAAFPEAVRTAVRDVLRVGGYKPTGRGKPASELLLAMARESGLPRIGNLVEINNLASLESALPISIFDGARLGPLRTLRFGREGERYVFNASGHAMDLAGLPVVCRGEAREPVGNAVRDAMACKVSADTTSVLAVVYGTRALPEAILRATCERLVSLLRAHAFATQHEIALVPSS